MVGGGHYRAFPDDASITLDDVCLGLRQTGQQVDCVQWQGGMISNLKVWENLLLPAVWRNTQALTVLEQRLESQLEHLGWPPVQTERWLTSMPGNLADEERLWALLLRGVFTQVDWILIDPESWQQLRHHPAPLAWVQQQSQLRWVLWRCNRPENWPELKGSWWHEMAA